jgi:NTE family protein
LFDFHKAEYAIEQGRIAMRRYLASMRRDSIADSAPERDARR